MSKETMVAKLVGEAYAATTYDVASFRPMAARRAKRLLNNFEQTSWNTTETLNRAVGAHLNSIEHRRNARFPIAP